MKESPEAFNTIIVAFEYIFCTKKLISKVIWFISKLMELLQQVSLEKYRSPIQGEPRFGFDQPSCKIGSIIESEKIILVIGANDIDHKIYQEIVAECVSFVEYIHKRLSLVSI